MTEFAPILLTSDLTAGYAGKPLFSGLNLALPAGQLVCFMGPNGVGKSTLIRTLAGLQLPLAGTVTFTGKYTQRTAVVLTDRVSAGYMTVRQLVTFGRYPYLRWSLKLSAADREVIDQAIARLHLEDLADRRLYALSDGQLQLAQIARALAQDTPVILLDEPTAHLDLNNRVEITLLLQELAHHSGKAILMATHELDLALQLADEVWLAGNGTGMLTGTPEDLVLSGTFDDIFRLKGFDLRTGKVHHATTRRLSITVAGDAYAARWTRNALERSGYAVVASGGNETVRLDEGDDNNTSWILSDGSSFRSIAALLKALAHRDKM
jgi:iron complex transport system ATP-binding protein